MKNPIIFTREQIENFRVGDLAPNVFGRLSPITEIFALGDNIKGEKYICYYVKFGENSTISHSLSEGENHNFLL